MTTSGDLRSWPFSSLQFLGGNFSKERATPNEDWARVALRALALQLSAPLGKTLLLGLSPAKLTGLSFPPVDLQPAQPGASSGRTWEEDSRSQSPKGLRPLPA